MAVEQLPSGRWRGIYRTSEGKRRSKVFDHKRAAQRWAEHEAHEVRERGSVYDPIHGKVKWHVWAEAWWPSRGLSSGAEQSQRVLYRRFVEPRWGDVDLRAVEHLAVQAWVVEIGARLSESSTKQAFYLLSSSMKAALRAGHIAANPCQGVRLPKLPPAPERFLTYAESDRLIEAMPHPEHRILTEVLFEAGLRIGEAVGLHRHRVDLDRGTLHVVEKWSETDGLMEPHPKYGQDRVIPISDRLASKLLEHLTTRPAAGECGFRHERDASCRSPLVVLGPRGAVISPHNFNFRTWNAALRKAKIGPARVHDARHSYASRLIDEGVSMERLRQLLGHQSITTTQRYAHLLSDGHDEVRAAQARGRRGTPRGTTASVANGREESPPGHLSVVR